MAKLTMNEVLQANLEKSLKNTNFTYIEKNKLPRELAMSVADVFIKTIIPYKTIPEFNITPSQQGKNILFSIENEKKEALLTVLLSADISENFITITEIMCSLKSTF